MTRAMILLLCFCSVLLVCGNPESKNGKNHSSGRAHTTPVNAAPVVLDSFVEYGEYYGDISGIKEATLICYAGGRVSAIHAKPGSWAKKGKSLAGIDARKAETAYETAVLNENIAHDNFTRTKKHFEAGNAARLQLDQMKLAWLNAKASRIEAEKMRNGALCIAPFSGFVTDRYIELHEEIAPGSPTFALAQLSKMKIKIQVPENEISSIEPGNDARITIPSVQSDSLWTATVTSVATKAQPGTQKFSVELHMDNPGRLVNDGVTVRVQIPLRKLDSQVVVPSGTITTTGTQHFVYVVRNGTALKRRIRTGPSNETHTLVVSGLTEGDTLIVSGQQRVRHNSPVSIKNN
ncbi:MAG: efflux RND transporter periplasmic adaptor subunit [Chitinivibrionales bacterium]|nr:efflux RND transporter periplasmic adaptor subunit [Chitinivibrionales bacterium]